MENQEYIISNECSCSAGNGSCSNQSGCNSECDCMGCRLYYTAKEAKHNVLVRKMESIIEREMGAKLDKIARVAVDHMAKKWAMKMENKAMKQEEMENYSKKLTEAMK